MQLLRLSPGHLGRGRDECCRRHRLVCLVHLPAAVPLPGARSADDPGWSTPLISGASASVFQVLGGYLGDRYGHRRTALSFSVLSVLASVALAVSIILKAPTWSVIVAAALVQTLGAGNTAPWNAIIANASPKGRMTESYGLLAMIGNVAWAIGPLLGGYLLGIASFAWLFGIGVVLKALALVGLAFVPADSQTGDLKSARAHNFKALIPDPTFIIFGVGVLLFFLTLSQWGGTLSVFTIDRIGFTTGQYGLLMSISSILIIIFQYPISHRMAEKPRMALVLGCLFYAFGFLSLAWVKSFLPSIGSIAIMVTGEMLFIPSALAVVGQMSGSADRGKTMGFYALCTTMGVSLGPLLGGFLLDKYPKTPLYLWGPISLCSFIAAIGFAVWKGYSPDGGSSDGKTE
ncbi:MAG: MFS transporter [Chloroflexi bacterium]|nr:MFS transporter [Chloroflexota bacterium]